MAGVRGAHLKELDGGVPVEQPEILEPLELLALLAQPFDNHHPERHTVQKLAVGGILLEQLLAEAIRLSRCIRGGRILSCLTDAMRTWVPKIAKKKKKSRR